MCLGGRQVIQLSYDNFVITVWNEPSHEYPPAGGCRFDHR